MSSNIWAAYRLRFELLTPMHIGWRKVGNLQQTRPYVLSRTLWGALTARLAREAGATGDKRLYKKIGEKLEKELRFSYFYLIDQIKTDLNCLNASGGWPWHIKGNNNDDPGLFDWKYLNSYGGSPITEQQVTEEGGLHETEHIMPFTREGKRVYLVGQVFERKKHSTYISNWKKSITRIQLGGERSYGWGKIALAEKIVETDNLFGASLKLDSVDPEVVIPANSFITSHVSLDEAASPEGFEGRIEMLAGRLTAEANKYGRNYASLLPCWTPGTRVVEEKNFFICSKGIWKES